MTNAFVFLTVFASIRDWQSRLISNDVCLLILFAFVMAVSEGGSEVDHILQHLMLASIAISLGFIFFKAKWWGGGDAKLFALVLLWIGPEQLPTFLVVTALALLMATLVAILKKMLTKKESSMVPFAIPIACGVLYVLPQTHWMQ